MQLKAAPVAFNGLKYVVIVVNEHVLRDENNREALRHRFKHYFPDVDQIVFMSEIGSETVFHGTEDIVRALGSLSKLEINDLPWGDFAL